MQIHDLKRVHKNKGDRIVGRGGKHAKTSGRGTKGQSSRAGNKKRPELRDIIKKLPKLRGYRAHSFEVKPVHISLDAIAKAFSAGGAITPAILLEKKAIKKVKGFTPKVKILSGKEKFGIKIQVSNCSVSSSAKEMIEKAGGEVVAK
ncbi:MAG: uL15 family ribosomal protein [Candidatus Nomurabacteria bacterium]|nr:uL15 family ribosomal protein [Candidatus Nomurabacteria bacterium]